MTSKKAAPRPVAVAPRTPAIAVVEQRPAVKATQRHGFKTNEYIVYPAHGVGQILSIEEQEVAGYKLELFVINFIKDKMTLRVPVSKVATVGMRKLSEGGLVKRALETLKGRARVKRTMWSRRAQEYEAKINSGDIVAIAEVVRDLFRSDTQPEQSYSERQLYEAALDRLSREISAVQHVTETEAVKEIEAALAKGPRRGPPKPAGEDEAEAVEERGRHNTTSFDQFKENTKGRRHAGPFDSELLHVRDCPGLTRFATMDARARRFADDGMASGFQSFNRVEGVDLFFIALSARNAGASLFGARSSRCCST